jgi:hypothetical protein
MIKLLLVTTIVVSIVDSAPRAQYVSFDGPRTGAIWPPYENAEQGYWALQAEKNHNKRQTVRKITGQVKPTTNLHNNKRAQILEDLINKSSGPSKIVKKDAPSFVPNNNNRKVQYQK